MTTAKLNRAAARHVLHRPDAPLAVVCLHLTTPAAREIISIPRSSGRGRSAPGADNHGACDKQDGLCMAGIPIKEARRFRIAGMRCAMCTGKATTPRWRNGLLIRRKPL